MILEQFSLKGKTAIVTGAARGIGQAIAVGFADAGANVLCVGRSSMDQTLAKIASNGNGKASALAADISTIAPIPGIVEEAIGRYGRLDILVNNSGVIKRKDAIDVTEEEWDAVIDLNLKTSFFFSQAAARQYLKQKSRGKIINILSMTSYLSVPRGVSYTTSKSGLLGMTRNLSNEWAKHDIHVNAIAPGWTKTDLNQNLRDDEAVNSKIVERIPAGRWGLPEEMAGAAVFLASDASNYMHGFSIAVDGGWLSR